MVLFIFGGQKCEVLFQGGRYLREGLIRMYTVGTASNRTAVVLYISEVKSEGSIRGEHIREGGLF